MTPRLQTKRPRSPEENEDDNKRITTVPDKLVFLREEYSRLIDQEEDEKAIEFLKNEIKDVNLSFHWGNPLVKAVWEKRYVVVDYILSDKKTTLDDGRGVCVIQQAVENNDFFALDKLLKRFPDKRYASTALKLSVTEGHRDLSIFLVNEHKATLHDSPLVIRPYFTTACKDLDTKIIKLLLNLGVDTFQLDDYGNYAVYHLRPRFWQLQTPYLPEMYYRGKYSERYMQKSTAHQIIEAHELVKQKMHEQLFDVMEEIAKAKEGSGMIKELNLLCIDYFGVDFDQDWGLNNSEITNEKFFDECRKRID